MNNILIIQTAFLGDVILATPVISELKRIFPQANIDILVKKGNESLLENNPHLRKVYAFDKSAGKLRSIISLTKEFRKQKYDLAINLHRFGSSGLITILSGAQKKYGFKKNPFSFAFSKSFKHTIGDGTHEVSRNLSVIKEFDTVNIKRPELFPSVKHYEKSRSFGLRNYSCYAPASVWFTKQLPEEKWIELIKKRAPIETIVLLGGANDSDLCERIIQQSGSDAINLAGKLNLLESAAMMSEATMNFVNDSGPLHLASAMNAPVTAFFCSTIPEFGFGPLSENSTIIEIQTPLNCRPCGLHGHKTCPEGHFKCGHEIKL